MYPKSLVALIDNFKKLPGVGEKTAERFALHLISQKQEQSENFSNAIIDAKSTIRKCSVCHFICEDEKCDICKDIKRNQNVICVVQSIKDVVILEKIGVFDGLYHVLDGVISPMEAIDVDDINIQSLISRLDGNIDEVIIAVSPTINGELTASYLSKLIHKKGVKVSRIAHGLPVGSDLEYADELTLFKALEGRREM